MTGWQHGRADITKLLKADRLDHITGPAASGEHHMAAARAALESAEREISHHAPSAYSAAYEASRKAATALLAQQGLRAKGGAHHVTVVEAVNAQFNHDFEHMRTMRLRRNQIEYPLLPGGEPDAREAAQALGWARAIIEATEQLLPQLGPFRS